MGLPVTTDKKPQNEADSDATLALSKEMLAAGPVRRWALKLSYSGNTVTVEPGGNIQLGRDKGNDLVVESVLASRHHARIFERDGHFVLADQSSNGTFLRHDGHINEVALKGNEAVLGERGWIGLGGPTASHGAHMLRYRLERLA